MAKPESEFPTIQDLRDRLTELIELGLGDHPVQIVIVPATTMKAVCIATGPMPANDYRPPLMIELGVDRTERMAVTIVSTDYLNSRGDLSKPSH